MAKPLAVVPDLEVELDNLYALAPAEFTAARNDLAKRLKQAGRDDPADEVKQLRKPTVPVWAVNQVARRYASDVKELVEASEQLRAAQRAALGGEESEKLRQATAAQRSALQTLTERAQSLLEAEGQSATSAVLERIASTLRAAALDPDNRPRLQSGRVQEELNPAGFDAFAGMPIPPRARGAARQQKQQRERDVDRTRRERTEKLREQLDLAEAAAEEAEREASRAEAEAAKRRAEADRIRARLAKS